MVKHDIIGNFEMISEEGTAMEDITYFELDEDD